jgi:DNA-binding ferritin-like protein
MATKLRNLRFNRIDVVDRPANPLAQAMLFKRQEIPSWLEAESALFSKGQETPPIAIPSLIPSLLAVIASSYRLYIMAHSAHWNVEGSVFPAWHDFFGDLYGDVFGAIDSFAESIRQHGAYAPTSFAEILGSNAGMPATQLISDLIQANASHMANITSLRITADAVGDEGLANYCQERLGKHLKYDWQLKAMGRG